MGEDGEEVGWKWRLKLVVEGWLNRKRGGKVEVEVEV